MRVCTRLHSSVLVSALFSLGFLLGTGRVGNAVVLRANLLGFPWCSSRRKMGCLAIKLQAKIIMKSKGNACLRETRAHTHTQLQAALLLDSYAN